MEIPTAPPPQSQRKRVRFSYSDDSDGDEAPRVKKVRFPKGKKDSDLGERSLGVVNGEEDEGPILLSTDPRVAALERATRRDRATEQLLAAEDTSVSTDGVGLEEEYDEEDEERVEDGMRIEPFNLKQEREEGYFDAQGNYVEYRNDNDARDAWLDSVEVDTRFAGKVLAQVEDDAEGEREMSKEAIAVVKRRIAHALESGETVLHALRRLSGRKGEQMSAETKVLFDQLTEDAMALLDNGDYNVYEEKKETFSREAEGYEALTRLRLPGSNGYDHSTDGRNDGSSSSEQLDIFSSGQSSTLNEGGSLIQGAGGSLKDVAAGSGNGHDVDIFGGSDDDDAHGTILSSNLGNAVQTREEAYTIAQQENVESEVAGVPLEGSGYVFDAASGYYYNSDIGYYYDANSGLYYNASTGRRYKFDEALNSYEDVS